MTLAKFVSEQGDECDEDGEEVWNVDGVAQENADDDDGEGLPVGDAVCYGVGVVEAAEADGCLAEEDDAEERPGEEPDQVEAPVEVAGELVVVHRDAPAEEAQEVLVDEVEPEEAVAVHAAGVAQAGEDVPGRGDGEEEQVPVKGLSRRQLRYSPVSAR